LQSFVKKVTSRVTDLLPQPAWLSKWFSSSVDSETHKKDTVNSNDSGSDDDEDDSVNMHLQPIKRAKIPLNLPFPPESFKVSPIVNDRGKSEELKSILKPQTVISKHRLSDPFYTLFV
jgi:nuclear pore complex protein Nup153